MAALGVVGAALALLGASSCGARPSADAFTHGYVTGIGGAAIPVGSKLGYLFAYLQNKSGQPLVIESITFHGHGIGSVVRPVQEDIAPLGADVSVVAAGGYVTDPPVAWTRQGCLAQTLRPLHGYYMPPRGRARIWVVFQAVGPGNYDFPTYTIAYTQGGTHQQQVLSEGHSGAVLRSAPVANTSPSRLQRRCLGHTSLLNPAAGQAIGATGRARARRAGPAGSLKHAGPPNRPAGQHGARAGSPDRRASHGLKRAGSPNHETGHGAQAGGTPAGGSATQTP
jgi:hypothetical protein